jgi:hypothetical protein
MYLGYERVDATATVKTASNLTIPAGATHAELMSDSAAVLYTMDNATDPNTALPRGMILRTTDPPKLFVIDDIRRIRFVGTPALSGLNLHYLGGVS